MVKLGKLREQKAIVCLLTGLLVMGNGLPAFASLIGQPAVYTTNQDFDEGTLVNVVHDPSDQLQLDNKTKAFNFVWVAVSSKGTAVKIDAKTGAVLGEYRTRPDNLGNGNPSRTTVDKNGNAWVTNRDESTFVSANGIAPGVPPADRWMGSVVQIGLIENGQCIDRNGNGIIETSAGLGDVKAWPNATGTDTLGGVGSAEDECVIGRVLVNSYGARHVSVNADNNVWISGTGGSNFDLVNNTTKSIIRQENSVGYGGYGGLISPAGVIWSANRLLRWDTSLPLNGPIGSNWQGYNHDSYGLGIDSHGNVWNTALGEGIVRKFAPDGSFIGAYPYGNSNAQGCVADKKDHIWVAHSLFWPNNTVGHILNDGTYIGNVTLDPDSPACPTGVAVDANGKIWATGYNSGKAYRIDPDKGPVGADGITPVGEVDLITSYLGGNLYNYSDMTGSTLIGAPNEGTWSVVHDSGAASQEWGKITWTSATPGNSSLTVTAASSLDGITFSPEETVSQGVDLTVPNGRYLKVTVKFTRSTTTDADGDGTKDSPILYDLTISTNEPPNCSKAAPSISELWPANHKMVNINITGVTDPDSDPVSITITKITQDEPVNGLGDGDTSPDGAGVGTSTAQVRAERSGKGNGRVYQISFTASDGKGGVCQGSVNVCVPHDQRPGHVCIDDGQKYNSTTP